MNSWRLVRDVEPWTRGSNMQLSALKTAGIVAGIGFAGAGLIGMGAKDLAKPDLNAINGSGASDVFLGAIGVLALVGAGIGIKETAGAGRLVAAAALGAGLLAGGAGGWWLGNVDTISRDGVQRH
jgi:hypothetical protein